MQDNSTTTSTRQVIALINLSADFSLLQSCVHNKAVELVYFNSRNEFISKWLKQKFPVAAIICQTSITGNAGIPFYQKLQARKLATIPFFLISDDTDAKLMHLALDAGIADVFSSRFDKQSICNRIGFVINNWAALCKGAAARTQELYKTPFTKRIFDIVFSSIVLLLLSPFFLIIIIALKLESKGPIFYYSLRVGTGYRIFRFYKFRSMYVNADQKLKDLQHLNQYNADSAAAKQQPIEMLCQECKNACTKCQMSLYADKHSWCEKQYAQSKKQNTGATFFKIKDDPRITKVGKILRNTSMDELPQLFNVLIGDMSIVGNRPLPLYEAEKLTTDKYVQRFVAPAGITGLWQVEKRGKGEMSEEERLMLDNMYARNHSFLNDIRLIFKTIPALFQKESV
ncbi:sugar transferase [Ilyomonas limi]|nr:sugar transferase [Ilyomonas limi]